MDEHGDTFQGEVRPIPGTPGLQQRYAVIARDQAEIVRAIGALLEWIDPEPLADLFREVAELSDKVALQIPQAEVDRRLLRVLARQGMVPSDG